MKRLKFLIPALFVLLFAFGTAGCADFGNDSLKIVCTIFPPYDWVRNLTEGNPDVTLTLIQDSGVDLHNYQATAADKATILTCDLLVYVGGESDRWVEDILKDPAVNPKLRTVKLLDEAETLDEEDMGGQDHEHDQEEETKDEHIWLSLIRVQKLVEELKKAISLTDPVREVLYEANSKNYTQKLSALEAQYSGATKVCKRNVLLFGDRFPFRYLAEDYGLDCFAAFSGCSAETEANFSTITRLAAAIDEYDIPYILILETSEEKLARQIIQQTLRKDQTIVRINSLQSVTRKQIEEGKSYLSLMEENLDVLKTVLN